MKVILASLAQVDIATFENAIKEDVSIANCYVLNESKQLTHLAIANNNAIDLATIAEYTELVMLCCYQCNLHSLPNDFGQLTRLTHLDLSHNRLCSLPQSMANLVNLEHLFVGLNPITEYITDVVAEIAPQDLLDYLLDVSQNTGVTQAVEARVVVLGDGGVGKTSIIQGMLGGLASQNSTQGAVQGAVQVDSVRLANDVKAHIWDFSSHVIENQLFKLFLNYCSLYALVLDANKLNDNANIYHWLSQIAAHSENAPIIVIVNKTDLSDFIFDKPLFERQYNIVDVIYVSRINGVGLAQLKQSLIKLINNLSYTGYRWPQRWRKVMDALSSRSEYQDFIEITDYEKLCVEHSINNTHLQKKLLAWLSQLGLVTSFEQSPRLSSMIIINPVWLITMAQRILQSSLVKASGRLDVADLDSLFKDEAHFKSRYAAWLVVLLNQFELITIQDNNDAILIPSKVNQEPNGVDYVEHTLNFRLHYQGYVGNQTIARLCDKFADQNLSEKEYWGTGLYVVLYDDHAKVQISEDRRNIEISATSSSLLLKIRQWLAGINGIHYRAVEQLVIMSDNQSAAYVNIDSLLAEEQQGEKFYTPTFTDGSYCVPLLIAELLYDYRLKPFISKHNFYVLNYHGIRHIEIDLPMDASWIFLTGHNGFGKTNILQAIARATEGSMDFGGAVHAEICLQWDDAICRARPWEISVDGTTRPVLGYGASRLDMGSDRSTQKYSRCASLFGSQVLLRNIEREGLSRWYFIDAHKDKFTDCVAKFKQLMPNLHDIVVDDESNVWYIEKDDQGDPLPKVQFAALATGYQNIIAMVGDIMLNLAEARTKHQETGLRDDLRAMVLIDELELYLHPSWQKRLPQLLTDLFPDVLFIASTHSPIPILGAPENSAVFTVNRTAHEGITMKRFDEQIDISRLLPNSLLTSPIFDMQDIIATNKRAQEYPYTQDSFEQIEAQQAMEQRIAEFDNTEAELQAIKRYERGEESGEEGEA